MTSPARRRLNQRIKKMKKSDSEFLDMVREKAELVEAVSEYTGTHPYVLSLARRIQTAPNWIPTKAELDRCRKIMEDEGTYSDGPTSLD